MKTYTYSEAQQHFSEMLDFAKKEEVVIKRQEGETFSITFKSSLKSPFDIPGIKTKAATQDIPDAVQESRSAERE